MEFDLAGLKEKEIAILKAFIRVCEKLDLPYFVMGGTMLGTVRHQGFIPWDDDIDVGMLRKDYDVFIEKGQALLPEGMFLQTRITDPEYVMNFAKIRDSGTTFVESQYRDRRCNHGIYIDIFPLDYYPESRPAQKWFDFRKKWRALFLFAEKFPARRKELRLSRRLVYQICRPFYRDLDTVLEKEEKAFRKVKKSGLIANYCGAWGKKEIMSADVYGERIQMPFEGIPVTLPKNYDYWLTHVYGDYMQLPPKEKQVAHHFADVIDVDRPYTDYIKP